jgi:hypothetical protein
VISVGVRRGLIALSTFGLAIRAHGKPRSEEARRDVSGPTTIVSSGYKLLMMSITA